MRALLLAALLPAGGAACEPDFPYKDGWLGGDAVYSVPLRGDRFLWLFGDTFVGKPGATDRRGAEMIANSVGLSRCRRGRWSIKYFWRTDAAGKPKAFFETGLQDVRYWPLDGARHEGTVYVALSRIRATGTGPFDFENAGTDIAALRPAKADPTQWEVRVSTFWPGPELHAGVSLVSQGGALYAFSVDARPKQPRRVVLARARFEGGKPASVSYLARDGTWKPGLVLADAKTVMDEAATEMTIRRHPPNLWVAVYPAPGLPSEGAAMRTAPALAGPWSAPDIVARYPETGSDPDTFCYAAKEHPRFADKTGLAVTYACNSFSAEKLLSRLELYRPRVLRVARPKG